MREETTNKSTVKIEHFESLSSTNEYTKQCLENGASCPFWIVSDEQTSGRGRQGRDWVSIKGNLYTSTAQLIKANGSTLSGLSLVTALAVYEAIQQTSSAPLELTLKWPNDILIKEAKLGGILIENVSEPNAQVSEVVIGVGINIQSSPVVEGRDTTCLADQQSFVKRDDLLNALIEALDMWLKRWDNGNNFTEIKNAWCERAATIGAPLSVRVGQERLTGKFAGLDEKGALKLELEDKTIKLITGGEII